MQYKANTVDVTNGSTTVTGNSTEFLSYVSVGDAFTVTGTGFFYDIASVDSDTQITLSAPYQGTTASATTYTIATDFTPLNNIVELKQGDIETGAIFTRAMRRIDQLLSQNQDAGALTSAGVYANTTDGIAGTSDGDYFFVPDTDEFVLYLNDTGSAVEQLRFASLATALQYATDAAQSATAAQTAETNAETAASNASTSESNAANSASAAANSASSAASSEQVATTQAGLASGYAGDASGDADRAEAARDAAQLSAGVYADTTEGLSNTSDGQYFSTPSGDSEVYLILYRNDSGVATQIQEYPSVNAYSVKIENQTGTQVVSDITTFTTIRYIVGTNNLVMFVNGVYQTKDVDYEHVDATSIRWLKTLNSSDDISALVSFSLTNSTTDTSAITHTEDSTDYNLSTYLQNRHGINVVDYGAVDGQDSTAALKAAFADLPTSGGVIELGHGHTYLFNPDSAFGIKLDSITNFKIIGNFSTIKCIDGAANAGDGVIFWFEDCEDGEVVNLFTDGNLANRTGTVSAGSHNVKLRNANKRIRFKNCKFQNATNDGFYVDATSASTVSTDIELIDCEASGCYRGNVSAIDTERFKIRGGRYHSASGANPQHGIDFEDNGTYGNKNWLVEDVDIYDNDGEGIQISGTIGVIAGKLKNIRLWNNGIGDDTTSPGSDFGSDIRVGLFDGLVIEDIYVKGNTNDVTRASIDFTSSASSGLVMKNVNMNDINLTGTGTKYCIYLHGTISGAVDIEGVTVNGTNVRAFHSNVDNITVRGLTVRNSTADAPVGGSGNRIVYSDMKMFNNAEAPIISGDACVVDGFHSVDCAATNFNLWMNGSDATLRNALAEQTTSIPSGQKGFTFTNEPREVSNIRAVSAGTDFDGTNILNLIGGVDSDTVLSNISPGHWTVEQISADQGDADKTLVRGTDEQVIVYNTALTTTRTVTLPTTNIKNGDKFKIIRTANATGASNLVVATVSPSNIALTAGDYVIVQYDGTNWVSVGDGVI